MKRVLFINSNSKKYKCFKNSETCKIDELECGQSKARGQGIMASKLLQD